MYQLILLFLFITTKSFAQTRFQFTQPKMGSPFTLIFYGTDSASAQKIAGASFALVDSLNLVFSDYLPDSEITGLSQTAGSGKAVAVSSTLMNVLLQSKSASLFSEGTFDITIGPLSKLWRKGRKEKVFPSTAIITEALGKTGMFNLAIDTAAQTVTLKKAGMQLDLGGIAKGLVAQKVVYFLTDSGIPSALVDAGGDIVCSGPPPGKKGWTLGINLPQSETKLLAETVEISHSAIATSGDLYQYLEYNGKRYSHIIDPRSGYGVPFQRNVTVIAPDGATADWLATACSILPVKKSKKLVQQYGAHLLITQLQRGKIKVHTTPHFPKKLRQ